MSPLSSANAHTTDDKENSQHWCVIFFDTFMNHNKRASQPTGNYPWRRLIQARRSTSGSRADRIDDGSATATPVSKSEVEEAFLGLPRITRKETEASMCISFGANRLEVYPHGWFFK
jgi:hypothetical protein